MLKHYVILGLLLLLTAILYLPTLGAGWVYDDANWVPLATHPLPHLSILSVLHVADWLGGSAPWAYHLAIVCAHLCNGVLLWTLLRRRCTEPIALLAAGLFLLHPLQAEAVAYVTGGREVLITTAVLVAISAGTKSLWRLGLAFTLTLLAARSKWSALPVFCLVPLAWETIGTDRSVRWHSHRRALLWSLGSIAVLALPTLLWLTLASRISLEDHARFVVLTNVAAWRYLGQILVPAHLSIAQDWADLSPWILMACLAATLELIIRLDQHRPRNKFAFGIAAWLALTLGARAVLPMENVPLDQQVLTSHHTYLPLLVVWPLVATALMQIACRLNSFWRIRCLKPFPA